MASFGEELREMIAARRSFGGHPLWHAIARGAVSRPGLALFAQQFFLQVREFPRAVSALHSNCPFAEERHKLAESVYEEETGRISGCNLPHPELFIVFGRALGLAREALVDARALPGTAALIDWFELASKQRSFIEGAAAINLAAEGQVPGAFGPFARALEKHYGLSREAVAFWDVHEIADRDHSDVGDHIVVRFADSEDLRARTRRAVAHSLDMWWQFFDGMERAIAEPR
jgi:pyrroloquinoline-quinone synthase